MPEIVVPERWQEERDGLMKAEKEATRALDALAARRRRLPMVRFDPARYQFASSEGPVTLIDLFGGRRQLVVYQFMDVGPGNFCPGCTNFTNNIVNLPSLTEYDASWANISDMPLAQIEGYKAQMGWTLPFVSSHGTSFTADCGVSTDNGFMLSVFLRDGDDVYRTYNTGSRGVDRLMFVTTVADLLPYGRQEDWEDSPAGWPQHPTYG
jgi:predicted dithiol-disulfide oxidoreductase (DUF899 family)